MGLLKYLFRTKPPLEQEREESSQEVCNELCAIGFGPQGSDADVLKKTYTEYVQRNPGIGESFIGTWLANGGIYALRDGNPGNIQAIFGMIEQVNPQHLVNAVHEMVYKWDFTPDELNSTLEKLSPNRRQAVLDETLQAVVGHLLYWKESQEKLEHGTYEERKCQETVDKWMPNLTARKKNHAEKAPDKMKLLVACGASFGPALFTARMEGNVPRVLKLEALQDSFVGDGRTLLEQNLALKKELSDMREKFTEMAKRLEQLETNDNAPDRDPARAELIKHSFPR